MTRKIKLMKKENYDHKWDTMFYNSVVFFENCPKKIKKYAEKYDHIVWHEGLGSECWFIAIPQKKEFYRSNLELSHFLKMKLFGYDF